MLKSTYRYVPNSPSDEMRFLTSKVTIILLAVGIAVLFLVAGMRCYARPRMNRLRARMSTSAYARDLEAARSTNLRTLPKPRNSAPRPPHSPESGPAYPPAAYIGTPTTDAPPPYSATGTSPANLG